MPRVNNLPKALKPYVWLGVNVDYVEGAEDVLGECPFCRREGKFSIHVEDGRWRCYVCNTGASSPPGDSTKVFSGGNVYTFIRLLHQESMGDDVRVNERSYEALANDRGLLGYETLRAWGVCQSTLTQEWLIPGYGIDGKLNQLYRYVPMPPDNKMKAVAIPDMPNQLFGTQLFNNEKNNIYVCEGPWDAMVLWEVLRRVKTNPLQNNKLIPTSNEEVSFLKDTNIIGVPGCGTFMENWRDLFSNKHVTLLYDNDHPRILCGKCKKAYSTASPKCPQCGGVERVGKVIPAGGLNGMKRVAEMLGGHEQPPKSIHYLQWGSAGYDPRRPEGFDVRDLITNEKNDLMDRIPAINNLITMIRPIPATWIIGRSLDTIKDGNVDVQCKLCTDWKTLTSAFKKALEWTEGLDRTLGFMLSCVLSTKTVGDQLWGRVIGPPASGKSTLCEALSINKKYTLAKSTIRGFHSGYKSDKGGNEDASLISQVMDKTLITKDGDTLMRSPNIAQILSEARDVYDRVSRTHYRNQLDRDYTGVNMTWILCGTASLHELDSSELGERFLTCIIMEDIEKDLEDTILERKAHQSFRVCAQESNGQMESQHDKEMVNAMQLTGGYISYLRQNASQLLKEITVPEGVVGQCVNLGKFVAYMRARPSKKQNEKAEREVATRLVSQMCRLAACTAVVLSKKVIDSEVMRRVRRVALDTARGQNLEIVKYLYHAGREQGMDTRILALNRNETEGNERKLLKFLKKIGVVEYFYQNKNGVTLRSRPRWRLTEELQDIYGSIFDGVDDNHEIQDSTNGSSGDRVIHAFDVDNG